MLNKIKILILKNQTIIFIIIGNLIPFLGVLFFSWQTIYIMFYYWLETVIIALYALLVDKITGNKYNSSIIFSFIVVLLFLGGYLLFIFAIFDNTRFISALQTSNRQLNSQFFNLLFSQFGWLFFLNLLVIFIAQGMISYKEFAVKKEAGNLNKIFWQRVSIVNFVITVGGVLTLILSSTIIGLLFLVVAKTVTEIGLLKFNH